MDYTTRVQRPPGLVGGNQNRFDLVAVQIAWCVAREGDVKGLLGNLRQVGFRDLEFRQALGDFEFQIDFAHLLVNFAA